VLGVFAAAGIFVLGSIAVTGALMPGCASCHLEGAFATATANGSHPDTPCGSCHGGSTVESRLSFGTAVVFGMVVPITKLDPAISNVTSSKCRACHAKDITTSVEAFGLRISHPNCSTTRECTDCHSPDTHGTEVSWPRSVTMDMCYDCHGLATLPSGCDLCHTERLPKDRVNTGTFAVTHGANAEQTHGLGKMRTCSQCHDSIKCAQCHGPGLPHDERFITEHGPVARSAAARCTECHTEQFCTDCHTYPMPHSPQFTAEHAATVEKDGQERCNRCHAPADCVDCHLDHVHPVTAEQLRALGVSPVGGGVR
jgi:hypothetical protein